MANFNDQEETAMIRDFLFMQSVIKNLDMFNGTSQPVGANTRDAR